MGAALAFLATILMVWQAGAQPPFPGEKFPVGELPESAVAADLDGDDPDVVTANWS